MVALKPRSTRSLPLNYRTTRTNRQRRVPLSMYSSPASNSRHYFQPINSDSPSLSSMASSYYPYGQEYYLPNRNHIPFYASKNIVNQVCSNDYNGKGLPNYTPYATNAYVIQRQPNLQSGCYQDDACNAAQYCEVTNEAYACNVSDASKLQNLLHKCKKCHGYCTSEQCTLNIANNNYDDGDANDNRVIYEYKPEKVATPINFDVRSLTITEENYGDI